MDSLEVVSQPGEGKLSYQNTLALAGLSIKLCGAVLKLPTTLTVHGAVVFVVFSRLPAENGTKWVRFPSAPPKENKTNWLHSDAF
jgi:hypothetical protein